MKEEYNQNISIGNKTSLKKNDLKMWKTCWILASIICSIFPENLTLENSPVQTTRINKITGAIHHINKVLK